MLAEPIRHNIVYWYDSGTDIGHAHCECHSRYHVTIKQLFLAFCFICLLSSQESQVERSFYGYAYFANEQ